MNAPLATDGYRSFLEAKVRLATDEGFVVAPEEVNPLLKEHQRDLVVWACRGGRRAIFAAFGLGKTLVQIEIMRLVAARAGGAVLIVLPLGVRQEFRRDMGVLSTGDSPRVTDAQRAALTAWQAGRPDRRVTPRFVRRPDEIARDVAIEPIDSTVIHLTNYESIRDGRLDPNLFTAASLDEAAVLRSFGSKTYQQFLGLFDRVRYRFVATATPSPNRTKELIHYAGFLGVMDTGQALTRFFQRNSEKAGDLQLYPHKEEEFWLWVHSWAAFVQRPSDLGYSDEGYALPPLDVRWHEVASRPAVATVDRDGQASLIAGGKALDLAETAAEKRESIPARIGKMMEIVREGGADHFILWHDLEAERAAIETALPDAKSVYGSLDLDIREERTLAFADGKTQYLPTKPEISGAGPNFQHHCHRAIFLGVGYKFHDFIQAVHRIWRFLQTQDCRIDIIHTEAERPVVEALKAKWAEHDATMARMSEIIRRFGLNHLPIAESLKRTIGVIRREAAGADWRAVNNDCVDEFRHLEAASLDLVVTSIPFSNHYEYSPSYNDFGHTEGNDHFWAQMDFLSPEMLRALKPGRLACIHVKDRILFGAVTGEGVPTVSPFHAEAIFHYRRHGFQFLGMITVVTDVVRENNQTYRLGYSEMAKDGTKMGVGSPEYILLMRRPQSDRTKGYADEPVTKDKDGYSLARWQVDAHAFWRSDGNRLVSVADAGKGETPTPVGERLPIDMTVDQLAALGPEKLARLFTAESLSAVYDHERHVAIGEALGARGALPKTFMALAPGSPDPAVWHDVTRMRTLNGAQARRNVELHLCPLQFDIVDRLIRRYSNPGELIADPFGGLMTVPYRALRLGRRGFGVELSPGYFDDGVTYLREAEAERGVPSLFDLIGEKGDDDAAR